uniref:RRM domain-containing protein n=1 Tax=Meloidogyne javanica TaxID=6303 RepID=A0A915LUL9_MELJA
MSNRRSRGGFVEGKVYVGGLPEDATSEEIDDAFHKFGRIRKIWVARRPPGFAFVEFDDHRDAEDAVRALDGTRICGVKARVELSTSSSGRLARRTIVVVTNVPTHDRALVRVDVQ